MRRELTVATGLAAVAAVVVLARTSGPTPPSSSAGSVPATSSAPAGPGPGGGGGLPLGAPQQQNGSGSVTVTGAVRSTYRFALVSCIRSPNTPGGLLAKGTSNPASPTPVTIGVTTDDSTLTPIELRLTSGRAWRSTRSSRPNIRREGSTVRFTAQLQPERSGPAVQVSGQLHCGGIVTLG